MRGVHITLRMRLFCEIFRDGKPIEGQQYEVLNEVVVDRGANPYLTKIECYEQGRLITKASCHTAVPFTAYLHRQTVISASVFFAKELARRLSVRRSCMRKTW